jgi:hypothetical protein
MLINFKISLSISSIYLVGIYIVSLLFGNDLFSFPFRQIILILTLLTAVPNANDIINYLQSIDIKLKRTLTVILILTIIPLLFDHIDYKTFLFGIGNISGLLSLVTGLISFVFKNHIYKIRQNKLNLHTVLFICYLLTVPLISYISFYYFKCQRSYAFYTILTTMELFGILMLLSISFKSVTQKIKALVIN